MITALTVCSGVWRDLAMELVCRCTRAIASVPTVHFLQWWEDLLARVQLLLQEALQVQEVLLDDVILQMCQPAIVKGVNLELQQCLLLRCQA